MVPRSIDMIRTFLDFFAVDTSPGDHQHDMSVESEGLPAAFVKMVATGAAAGLKDAAAKVVRDAYDALSTLVRGRHQKHQNVGKCR
jgi:hypothetical protein